MAETATDPIAMTTAGPVQGRIKRGGLLFGGVPYAAPPVGSLRFEPTAPAEPWTDVRPARRFGPAAPQPPGDGLTSALKVRWNEDCLTLNVQTPALDDGARPVLVWIHGGNYTTGQGAIPWYNGRSFVEQGDIVCVTINYRLGALGFVRLGDGAGAGLGGLQDQVQALRWVRDNIAAFGGDPGQVTIAGESAGAFSCGTLLAMPSAAGLFHRAILQSGAGHHTMTGHQADGVAGRFLEQLGVTDADGAREATVDQILAAQVAVSEALGGGTGQHNEADLITDAFYPSVDGLELPVAPKDAPTTGLGNDVAVLAGSNRHESALWGTLGFADGKADHLISTYRSGVGAELRSTYEAADPDASPAQVLTAIMSDWMFRIPAVRLAENRHAAEAAPTWMYEFGFESTAMDGALGACHALEIPFAFNNLHQPGVDGFLGSIDGAQPLADAMHRAWIDFVRDGDPGWRPYAPDDRAVRRFDRDSEAEIGDNVDADPRADERKAWDGRR